MISTLLQQSECPQYNSLPLVYNVYFTGCNQTRSCVSASCTVVFTEFPMNSDLINLIIVATNQTNTLKEFRLTVGRCCDSSNWPQIIKCIVNTGYQSEYYFLWTVNSTLCQQYSLECTAVQNATDSTMCSVRHTTGDGTSTIVSIPIDTQYHIPYINPGIIHHFDFSAMLNDHFFIIDSIRTG